MKHIYIILIVITRVIPDPEDELLTITEVTFREDTRRDTEQEALQYLLTKLERVPLEDAQEFTIIKALVKYED